MSVDGLTAHLFVVLNNIPSLDGQCLFTDFPVEGCLGCF
jgi:hypothetical protein